MPDKKSHWENIYGNKSPLDVSWHQEKPDLSLQLIHNTQLALDEPIIDVGGGASTLVDHLCDEGYSQVSVLDISAKALAHAKNRLGNKARDVEWYEQDIIHFQPPHPFTLWHDRAVFHFLTDKSDREHYVNVLKRVVKKNGHIIIAAFAIGGPTKCSGLDIVQYNAEKLMHELGEDFELVEEKNETHETPAAKQQMFNYFRLIRK